MALVIKQVLAYARTKIGLAIGIFIFSIILYLSPYFSAKIEYEITKLQTPKEKTTVTDGYDALNDELLTQEITRMIHYSEYQSEFGPLSHSLRGTYIPIHFVVNTYGELVVTYSIKTLIEYFLSANVEESIDIIKSRIEEIFDQNLNEPANSQAKAVLAQYFDYKATLIEVEAQQAEDQTLSMQSVDYQRVLAERSETRLRYLDQAVYDAFYLNEDSLNSYTAALLAVNKSVDLTAEEKEQKALELISLLPAEEQIHKRNEYKRAALQQKVFEAKDQGASAEEIYQLRVQVYEPDTVERLAQSDAEQGLWNTRFSNYRQYRQIIIEGEGMSEFDKKHEISELQKKMFDEKEQIRLKTLDKMADSDIKFLLFSP